MKVSRMTEPRRIGRVDGDRIRGRAEEKEEIEGQRERK
jgi:hypothetical protein